MEAKGNKSFRILVLSLDLFAIVLWTYFLIIGMSNASASWTILCMIIMEIISIFNLCKDCYLFFADRKRDWQQPRTALE